MTGKRLFLVAGNFGVRQAGEVVVALVVLAHMIEAEQKILSVRVTPNGSAMYALLVAAVPLADRSDRLGRLGFGASGPVTHPDLVEVF